MKPISPYRLVAFCTMVKSRYRNSCVYGSNSLMSLKLGVSEATVKRYYKALLKDGMCVKTPSGYQLVNYRKILRFYLQPILDSTPMQGSTRWDTDYIKVPKNLIRQQNLVQNTKLIEAAVLRLHIQLQESAITGRKKLRDRISSKKTSKKVVKAAAGLKLKTEDYISQLRLQLSYHEAHSAKKAVISIRKYSRLISVSTSTAANRYKYLKNVLGMGVNKKHRFVPLDQWYVSKGAISKFSPFPGCFYLLVDRGIVFKMGTEIVINQERYSNESISFRKIFYRSSWK